MAVSRSRKECLNLLTGSHGSQLQGCPNGNHSNRLVAIPITCVYFLFCLSRYDTSLANECMALADRWATSTDADQFSPSDIQTMSSHQVRHFLDSLLEKVDGVPCGVNLFRTCRVHV